MTGWLTVNIPAGSVDPRGQDRRLLPGEIWGLQPRLQPPERSRPDLGHGPSIALIEDMFLTLFVKQRGTLIEQAKTLPQ